MYGALLLSPVPCLNCILNHHKIIFSKSANTMQVDDKRFSFSTDRYLACDLVMYECAVNRSIFLAKN